MSWDGEKREVTIENDEKTIAVKIGARIALVNNEPIKFVSVHFSTVQSIMASALTTASLESSP